MTDGPAASERARGLGGGIVTIIVLLLLLVVGVSAAVGAWFYRLKVLRRNTAEATVEEYLRLKSQGYIKAVHMMGDDLFAEMAAGGFVRDNRAYKRIHCIVPPPYLVNPKAFDVLHSGLSPSQFIDEKD